MIYPPIKKYKKVNKKALKCPIDFPRLSCP